MDNTAKKMFETEISVTPIQSSDIELAKTLFETYKKDGIITKCTFEDTVWQTTDEYSNVGLYFDINEFSYQKNYADFFKMSYEDFVMYLKISVVYKFGNYALSGISNFILDIKHMIETPNDDIKVDSSFYSPIQVSDFLSVIPIEPSETFDELLDKMDVISDYIYSSSSQTKRNMASFDSYFLFNDVINDYWSMNLTKEERMFYYPLYLWWMITGVIPVRPREFLLTPRNCLEFKGGEWWITLRKNVIKGSERKKSYKIDYDYVSVQYPISQNLANEINKYIEFTKDFESTDLKTLLITDPHYEKWARSKAKNNRYFSYVNMCTVLKYFYNEILIDKYGLNLVKKDKEHQRLKNDEIQFIHLGDARVISMVNLMREGGTPVLAMYLAGHENIEMSSHYFSNISSLIECRTYKQYRKVLQGTITYSLVPKLSPNVTDRSFIELENGNKCYSENSAKGDLSDCNKVSGPNGEIGYCPNCPYFRNGDSSFYANGDFYKNNIKNDCKHLNEVVKLVRLNKGNTEDILQALLRLQNSSYDYQQYCKEKVARGEKI